MVGTAEDISVVVTAVNLGRRPFIDGDLEHSAGGRLTQVYPNKMLIPLSGAAICGNMKLNTLAKLAWSLDHERHEVVLEESIRLGAERALRRMLELSGGWSAPSAEESRLEEAGLRKSGCGCA